MITPCRGTSRVFALLTTTVLITGCAEYIIAEAALNAAYHGTKALADYSKSDSSKVSKVKTSKVSCAFPDGKIYQTLPDECPTNSGVVVQTDSKTKFGCRKSDGTVSAATYTACQARSGWIDNLITVTCTTQSGATTERTAHNCLRAGYKVSGTPSNAIAKATSDSAIAKGRCELEGSGFISVQRSVCHDLGGSWISE